MITKLVAVLGLLILSLIAVPSAALAYVPDGDGVGTVTGRPTPGATVNVAFDRLFEPGERVEIVVSCPGAADMVLDEVAGSDGSTNTDLQVPDTTTGTCTIAARGVSSGAAGTAAFTVIAADSEPSDSSGGLAVTGGTALAALWVAGGAIALGVVLVLVRAMRRKSDV